MQIYWFGAQGPRRACTVAKHLGVDTEYVKLDLLARDHKSPAFLAINPNGKAPALVDGDLKLWESLAICAHLSNAAGADMWPATNPAEQVEVLRWCNWDAWQWSRGIGVFYVENYVKPHFGFGEPDKRALEAATPGLHANARILDDALSDRKFLAAGRFTVADVIVNSMLPDWEQNGAPLQPYANLRRWHDRLMDIPAVREPWPETSTTFVA